MKRYLLKIFGLSILLISIYSIKSNAAISASSKTVNSGENVSISITSNVAVVSYKVTMTNAGGLTFVNSSGGEGAGTTSITDAKSTGMRSLATYTFKTPNVSQDTTYRVTFSATIMEDENLNPVNDSTATATITVKASGNTNAGDSGNSNAGSTSNKSTNADLSNLGITPNDFKGFKAATTSYNVSVPSDVKSVKVYATAKDSKAKISGTGYKELSVGKNTIKVVVTAEAGNTKTYTLNITREGEETVVPNTGDEGTTSDNQNNNEELNLTNIILDDKLNLKLSPNFSPDIFEYTVDLGEEYKDLEELEITAIANINNAQIDITGNKQFKDGENVITILVTNPETNEKVTYTIIVNKNNYNTSAIAQSDNEDPNVDELNDFTKEQQRRLNIKIWTINAIIIVVTILIIILLILRYKTTQKQQKQLFDDYNDEEDNYDYNYNQNELNYENSDILNLEHNPTQGDVDENIEDTINDDKDTIKEKYLDGFGKQDFEFTDKIDKKSKSKSQGKHF